MIEIDIKYFSLYHKAIKKFGKEKQLVKCIEELSELQKEICKLLINKGNIENIYDEIADAIIMIDQLYFIIGASGTKLKDNIDFKLNRLENILK